jgi:hypothetical protein
MSGRRDWRRPLLEIGRIDKTIHTLNFIDDEARRRSTLAQLNLGEGRDALARDVSYGKCGELYRRTTANSPHRTSPVRRAARESDHRPPTHSCQSDFAEEVLKTDDHREKVGET